MKTLRILLCITLVCVAPLVAEKTEPFENVPTKHRETKILMQLLDMPADELTKLRKTIEYIEQMPPQERSALRERIVKLQKMKPERYRSMRQRFDAISLEDRQSMRQRWLDMKSQERREWRQKLRTMTHEERATIYEDHGFLPRPKKRHGQEAQN